jgi:hypothetical protein
MISIFVFRRYGLAVPVTWFLVGWLLQTIIDQKYGSDYYTSHFWTVGLSFFLSGVLLTVMAYLVDDENTYKQDGYSLADVKDIEVGNCVQNFVNSPSQSDIFCYVPFNYCALLFMGVGVLVMLLQLFPFA